MSHPSTRPGEPRLGPPGPGPRGAHPHVQKALKGIHRVSTHSCTTGHVPTDGQECQGRVVAAGPWPLRAEAPSMVLRAGTVQSLRHGAGATRSAGGGEGGRNGVPAQGQKVARPRSPHNPKRSCLGSPGWSEQPIPRGVEGKLQGPWQRRGQVFH